MDKTSRRTEQTGHAQLLLTTGFLDVRCRQAFNTRSLGVILRLVATATSTKQREDMCCEMLDILLQETNIESGSMLLYLEERDQLVLAASGSYLDVLGEGAGARCHSGVTLKRDGSVQWQVHDNQSPVFIGANAQDPASEGDGTTTSSGYFVCLPLLGQGVLTLSSSEPRTIAPFEQRDLIIIATIMGHLLRTAGLEKRLEAGHRQLQEVVETTTQALHQTNDELRGSLAYLESVIEHAPQGICLLGPDGLVSHVNSSFLDMMHCDRPDVEGQDPLCLFQDAADHARLTKALAEHGLAHLTDTTLIRPDGSRLDTDIFLHPLGGAGRESQGGMLVVHDLTRQKEFTQELVNREKLAAVGSMASGVAHDFNNLLTTILGNCELLSGEEKDATALRRLTSIKKAAARGARRVRQLQTFTEFRSKKSDRLHHAADVNGVIREAVELTSPRWRNEKERDGATIALHLDLHECARVAIKPSELREVLTHLILNAVDAMPQGGNLSLSCLPRGDNVVIEVTDTGAGMSKGVQQRAFDPFFTTKGMGYSGLGLSVTFGMVLGVGGKIEIRSEQGQGTTLIVSLPVAAEGCPRGLDTSAASESRLLRILTVDDEPEIVELLCTVLKNAGHQVTGVTDGEAALETLAKADFDLVLTDLGMPGVNGWDIALAAAQKEPRLPVVLLTGWGAQHEEQDLKELGIVDVIGKPFRSSQLLETIGRLFPSEVPKDQGPDRTEKIPG